MKDDDKKTGTEAEAEAEATPEERAHAQSLARLTDAMLAGAPPPPALEAEERALLETATAIHAALGRAALADDRRARVLERAFAAPAEPPAEPPAPPLPTVHGRGGGSAWRARAPWIVAVACAAAAAVLALRPPARTAAPSAPVSLAAPAPPTWRSRPADPIVGRIARADADRARARLDAIYADRMAGYRQVRLGGVR